MSHSHLVLIESGKSLPSLEFFVTLAEYFGVSANDLLEDDRELPRK